MIQFIGGKIALRLLAFLALLAIFIAGGILLRRYEINRIKYSDEIPPRIMYAYRTSNPLEEMNKARQSLKMDNIYIQEEDLPDIYNTIYIATSSKYWIKSRYLHRIIIMTEPVPGSDNSREMVWQVRSLDRRMESWSMFYFTIFMISMLVFVVFNTKEENLPHIFGHTSPEETPDDQDQ